MTLEMAVARRGFTMRRNRFMAAASLLVLLMVPLFSVQQAASQKTFTRLHLCYVNTTEKEIPQGKIVIVIFGVFYSDYSPCGDPCELRPRLGQTQPTGSFVFRGTSTLRFIDITVTPTGKPGEYKAEINWPQDAPIEKIIVFVFEDSLYDGKGTGPERDSSHSETPDPIDDSTFISVRSAHPIVAIFDFIPGGLVTVLVLVAALALLAFLVLLATRLRKKSQRSAN